MDGSLGVIVSLLVFGIFSLSFLTASKTSLTTIGDMGIKQIISSADLYGIWLNHSARLMSTIVFCRTTLIVMISVIAAVLAESFLPSLSLVAPIALTIFVLVVFAETLPKAFAKKKAALIVPPSLYILRILYYLCYPVTSVMLLLAAMTTGSTADSVGAKRVLTEDELEYLIDVSEEQGVLEEQKQQMLANIFDISDIYVKAVMVPRTEMIAVPHDIDKEELIKLVQETEYSRIPVYEDTLDRIIGILYTKQIIKMTGRQWDVKELMSTMHSALFVPETKKIDDMLKEFQRTRQHIAVVVDEYGGVSGIVTMENVLEEIVGDIRDEYDDEPEEEDIIKISDTEYNIAARTNIDDLCDFFDIERTDDMSEYDTVGGLIYDIAGAIPSVGDLLQWRGFEIKIQSMNDNRIQRVVFIKTVEPQE